MNIYDKYIKLLRRPGRHTMLVHIKGPRASRCDSQFQIVSPYSGTALFNNFKSYSLVQLCTGKLELFW